MSTRSLPSPLLPSWPALRVVHPSWAAAALVCLVLFAAFLPMIVADPRQLHGVSVWIKPAKFALSIAVYLGTLVCFATLVPPGWWQTRTGRATTQVALGCAAFELAYIVVMAGRGEASHYNATTSLTSAMYTLMGIGAVLLTLVSGVLAVVIARHRAPLRDPVVLAIVLGLALTVVLGGGFGVYMGAQTSHWVGGAPTDANGLPVFGWARDGGDLRVAHFFGMHAMQVLPLFALLVRGLAAARMMIVAGAVLYAGVCVFTFVGAVGGRPLI